MKKIIFGKEFLLMENEKLENKTAIYLSGLLEGAKFEQGINLIRALPFAHTEMSYDNDNLCSLDKYKFRAESSISVKGMDDKGLDCIYFRLNVNATRNEMIELLEVSYVEYDEDWDEDKLTEAFWSVFNDMCNDSQYDYLTDRFDDVLIEWEITTEEEGCYYCCGKREKWL